VVFVFTSVYGRIPRSTYIVGVLIHRVLFIGAMMYFVRTVDANQARGRILWTCWLISGLWSWVALEVKRWHDRDKAGWWMLISCLPVVNLWAIVELFLERGSEGINRYGADPLIERDS
jgi:uncharacterized membrane protein YhaH (DUF805 family)